MNDREQYVTSTDLTDQLGSCQNQSLISHYIRNQCND